MNTEIGLPISILNGYSGQRVAVLEMGVSRPGDMDRLCTVSRPTVGVLLNVGRQHLGNFRSDSELLREKTKIFDCSEKRVYNADDPRLNPKSPMIGFGKSRGDVTLIDWRYSGLRTEAVYSALGEKLFLRFDTILHEGHLLDVAAAISTLTILGEPLRPELHRNPPKERGRFREVQIDGILLIDDTYNASLSAFEVALRAIERIEGERKLAVVGPILEQGRFSGETHEKLSELLEVLDGVYVLDGFEGSVHIKPSNVVFRSESKDELARAIFSEIRNGDVILFKASRAVGMEEVLERVIRWMSR